MVRPVSLSRTHPAFASRDWADLSCESFCTLFYLMILPAWWVGKGEHQWVGSQGPLWRPGVSLTLAIWLFSQEHSRCCKNSRCCRWSHIVSTEPGSCPGLKSLDGLHPIPGDLLISVCQLRPEHSEHFLRFYQQLPPVHFKGAHLLWLRSQPRVGRVSLLFPFLFLSAFYRCLRFLGFAFRHSLGFLVKCSLMNHRTSERKGILECNLVQTPQTRDEKLNLKDVMWLTHLRA